MFRDASEEQAFVTTVIQQTGGVHAARISGPTTTEDDAATKSYLEGLHLRASAIGPPTTAADDDTTRQYLDALGVSAKRLRSTGVADDEANRSYVDSLEVSAGDAKRLRSGTAADADSNRTYINGLEVAAASAHVLTWQPWVDADTASNAWYVRAVLGLGMRPPVVAVIDRNRSTLPSGSTDMDGYVPALDDRVLLTGQTDAVQNGVYVVQPSGRLVRSADMAEGHRCSASAVFCAPLGTMFVCVNATGSDCVGRDALEWREMIWDAAGVRRCLRVEDWVDRPYDRTSDDTWWLGRNHQRPRGRRPGGARPAWGGRNGQRNEPLVHRWPGRQCRSHQQRGGR